MTAVKQCAFCGVDCDGMIFAVSATVLHYGRQSDDTGFSSAVTSSMRSNERVTLHFCTEDCREHYYFGA